MFSEPEIRAVKNFFSTFNVDNDNNYLYLTSNSTKHLWIIRKIYTPELVVSVYHKRPSDKRYHLQRYNVYSVKNAIQLIVNHDIYILQNHLK